MLTHGIEYTTEKDKDKKEKEVMRIQMVFIRSNITHAMV